MHDYVHIVCMSNCLVWMFCVLQGCPIIIIVYNLLGESERPWVFIGEHQFVIVPGLYLWILFC